jgi:hypothetical protein
VEIDRAASRRIFEIKGPRKNYFHILGVRIWVRFVRSQRRKTGGIASSFEDFAPLRAGEDGLKPGWIKGEIIFTRALTSAELIGYILTLRNLLYS